MKIIITAESPSLDSSFNPRFGRSPYFIIVDPGTLEWEAHTNPAVNAPGGAGTMSAQFAANNKVEAVISGGFGPNASSALNAAGILMYLYRDDGNIGDIIERFKAGDLQQISASNPFSSPRSRRK
jgi:predicted Fe-Mo cluster-binding NifX family protein